MNFRKIVSTILIAAMLFFAPSMIPVRAFPALPCGTFGWLPTDTAFARPTPHTLSRRPANKWNPSRMVLGRIRLSGFDHPLRHRRQLSRQPAIDHCGSLDVRFVVLDSDAGAAAAGAPSPLSAAGRS
jgi:hypothetical protein